MREEKHQRTWETQLVPARAGRRNRPKEGEPRAIWESDQLIVLRERESRLQGEGADVDTKPAKETLTERAGPGTQCKPPCWERRRRVLLTLHAGASVYEEPGAGKLHAGICAGAVR